MLMTDLIQVTQNFSYVTLTLNRPEKGNALSGPLLQAFLETLNTLSVEKNCQVLVLTAKGNHFCAGADLAWMQTLTDEKANRDDAQLLADVLQTLYHFPAPTLALAQGAIRGGGMGLLAACNIVIATETASFGFSEVKLGLTPSIISPYVLAAMNKRAVEYYFLTGENFTAADAYRLGFVHKMVKETNLISAGESLVKQLLKNAPHALREVKTLIHNIDGEKISAALIQKTAEHLARIRKTPEAKEGIQAFVEKRDPTWSK